MVRDAAVAFQDAKGSWPEGDGTEDSSAALLKELREVRKCREILSRLPKTAVVQSGAGSRLIDGFGNPFIYKYDTKEDSRFTKPELKSLGPDMKDETDDIPIEFETRTAR